MALGQILKQARSDRNLTTSQVAAATRMKVQLVEAIEEEDFSKIAAPIYGKGFIKLYAEEVGLDPSPLIHEYVTCFVGSGRSQGLGSNVLASPPADEPEPAAEKKPEKPPEKSSEKRPEKRSERRLEKRPEKRPAAPAPEPEPEPEPPERTLADLAAEEESDDPDLFSGIVDRKEDRDFGQHEKRPGPDWSAVRDTIMVVKDKIMKEGVQPCVDLWRRGSEAVRDRTRETASVIRKKLRRKDISSYEKRMAESKWSIRTLSLWGGVIGLLILLGSCLSNCHRRSEPGAPPPNDADVRRPLRTAIDPPDPYIE